ncbi:hypothetical protein AXG93_1877s1000 [Marchantia polymorpha subsp. ruderalis]|uniref:Uncharacterized protein n=1 Tax=Marchantia polymorpha subsp. ruderalis TaxID=1480154 RepID=A0A176VRP3_MARPO|nr:hypothetical protein AXG93_1877s1000 [Marchantia polymorpha subsp. ruderalis]
MRWKWAGSNQSAVEVRLQARETSIFKLNLGHTENYSKISNIRIEGSVSLSNINDSTGSHKPASKAAKALQVELALQTLQADSNSKPRYTPIRSTSVQRFSSHNSQQSGVEHWSLH